MMGQAQQPETIALQKPNDDNILVAGLLRGAVSDTAGDYQPLDGRGLIYCCSVGWSLHTCQAVIRKISQYPFALMFMPYLILFS